MKEGPVCDCSDCMLIKFISTVLLSSLFCIQEMCGLRARYHKAQNNQISLYPAPLCHFSSVVAWLGSVSCQFRWDHLGFFSHPAVGIGKSLCLLKLTVSRLTVFPGMQLIMGRDIIAQHRQYSTWLILQDPIQRSQGLWPAEFLSLISLAVVVS